jgi:hypothetical protein
MHTHFSKPDEPEATDGLYDTSPAAMAARFGARTRELLRDGREVRQVVRLAASYAFLADPSLRDQPTTFGENLFALGRALASARERRVH